MRNLKEFEGDEPIFIDANIFLHHAFDSRPGAVEFLARLERQGLRAYTSTLVLEEVMFILLVQSLGMARAADDPAKLNDTLMNPEARKLAMLSVRKYFEYIDVLKACGLQIISLTDGDLSTALDVISGSGIMTADACHVAVMKRKGISHIATADGDFARVADIVAWTP